MTEDTGNKRKTIALIAAVAKNGVIGADNDMPWRLSTDLKRFKALTLGKPVIMGRKTFESIGRPLPNRENIIVTRDTLRSIDGVCICGSLEAAIEAAKAFDDDEAGDEVMIAGGGDIYRQVMPLADKLYITHVNAEPDGDTFFPEITSDQWHISHEETLPMGDKDSASTRFCVYVRNNEANPL